MALVILIFLIAIIAPLAVVGWAVRVLVVRVFERRIALQPCPHLRCEHKNPRGARFCAQCGRPL